MTTPILETERLVLRPMTVQDAEAAYANWTSDPDISRFMRWARHESVEVTREWLRTEEALADSDAVYNWGFVLRETDTLIGSGGLVFVEDRSMYELGYNVMKSCWNRGLATEAAAAIIEFGRTVLGQKQFFCCHAKENPASGRVMTKIGFVYQQDGTYTSWDGTRTFDCREYLLRTE